MRYILASLLPPIAVIIYNFSFSRLLTNVILTACYFWPGVLHALYVVSQAKEKNRTCEICLSPIIHQGYTATINGQKFKLICAKCKNKVTDGIRKKRMADLIGCAK